MCAQKQADYYYRFFVDNDKLGDNCIFVRKNPADTTLATWDNKWNQTPSSGWHSIGENGHNCFNVSGWDSGSWGDYSNE